MPADECYLEVGTLEGRTLEAAAAGNEDKLLIGCDPCEKYGLVPDPLPPHVVFIQSDWRTVLGCGLTKPIGCVFYDGDHRSDETRWFMKGITTDLADEAVLVLDDWDRQTVRQGAFSAADEDYCWQLLREMPEYTDGLTTAPHHFGYSFGVAVWGYRR
jgi:hypothetical protein